MKLRIVLWTVRSVILVALFERSTSCPISGLKKFNPLEKFLTPFQACCCTWKVKYYPSIEAGDFVKIWWRSRKMRSFKVFHWTYAITDDQVFHFLPINKTHGTGLMEYIDDYEGAFSVGPNPRKVARLPHYVSNGLAHRLTGLELPFDYLFCNCRHYVDYLVYGRTFGKRWNHDLSEWPIEKLCPLHRQITAQTDVDGDDFFLEDGVKTRYRVNPIPD